jgi:hypothetical protein
MIARIVAFSALDQFDRRDATTRSINAATTIPKTPNAASAEAIRTKLRSNDWRENCIGRLCCRASEAGIRRGFAGSVPGVAAGA